MKVISSPKNLKFQLKPPKSDSDYVEMVSEPQMTVHKRLTTSPLPQQ
jgi:hypothetical protein